ncbi:MAG TPA: DinB family protein, partial [Streptomyces sp.]|nr:DinB family protein [Streptomyces sp.]
PTTAGEREMLEGWLDFHRGTLASKCEGLSDAQLREMSAAPSGLSLLGLVRHMAENERGWFRETMAGEDLTPLYCTDEDPEREFHVTEQDTWAEAYTTWQGEIGRAREQTAAHSLDDMSRNKHPRTGESFNLRWIMTHMIEEYARHNGHADLIRERIDGATGA